MLARVSFTPNLARHVACPPTEAAGDTVREVLDRVLESAPQLRGYILDDQGGLRRHMSVFVDGRQVKVRAGLSDPIAAGAHIFVAQALSGG